MAVMTKFTKLPPLKQLPNGIVIPTEELIIAVHENIINYRKSLGKNDTSAIRDRGLIKHLCDTLTLHRYKHKPLDDTFYVATQTFFYIACQHPFHDGNKSTAYIMALLLLHTNAILNQVKLPDWAKKVHFEIHHKKEVLLSAPKEAEEITRLAEGGKDDAEIKRLIRKFLENQIGMVKQND